jgi:hypothetical protein
MIIIINDAIYPCFDWDSDGAALSMLGDADALLCAAHQFAHQEQNRKRPKSVNRIIQVCASLCDILNHCSCCCSCSAAV